MSDDHLLDDSATPIVNDPPISEQIAELKRENQQSPVWLPLVIICAVAWAVLGIWLSQMAGWPEGYGYHFDCVYRACVVMMMIYSPALLTHPTIYSLALFAWYAAMAAFLLWVIVGAAKRKSPGEFLFLIALVAGAIAVILLSPGGGAHD